MATLLGGAPLGYGGLGWSYPENAFTFDITLPAFEFVSESGFYLEEIILPTLEFEGASAFYLEEITLPALTAEFSSNAMELAVVLPPFAFVGTTAAYLQPIELQPFNVSFTSAFMLDVELQPFEAAFATGATLNVTLPALTALFGYTFNPISFDVTLKPFVFHGSVDVGTYMELVVSLPPFSAAFAVSGDICGVFAITLPAFAMYATLRSATVVATATSTKDGALTEYSNYDFNSFATIAGKYLGAGDDGLVELSGDDDMGVDIGVSFETGLHDGGMKNVKWMPNVKVVMKSDGSVKVRGVYDGVQKAQQTILTTVDVLMPKNVKLDKGPDGMLLGVQMENVDGAAFEVALIEMLPELTKRIGK